MGSAAYIINSFEESVFRNLTLDSNYFKQRANWQEFLNKYPSEFKDLIITESSEIAE